MDHALVEERLYALSRKPFRAKFCLRGRDAAIVQLRGRGTIRAHAHDLISKRVATARRDEQAAEAVLGYVVRLTRSCGGWR